MPVMERGIGLDRTYHNLPVLFVDDYSHITPELLRQVNGGVLSVVNGGNKT